MPTEIQKYTRFIRGRCPYCGSYEFYILGKDARPWELECLECGAGGKESSVRLVDNLPQREYR